MRIVEAYVIGRVAAMSRKAKVSVAVALFAGLGLLALTLFTRLAAVRSSGDDGFLDLDWLNTASDKELEEYEARWRTLSPQQKRTLAHRALTRTSGNHHDAFLILVEHGKEESVPYLLDWLQAQGDLRGDGVVCTRSHCVEALEKITGKKLGYNYSDWKGWDKQPDR
jgi:hypothetical protein